MTTTRQGFVDPALATSALRSMLLETLTLKALPRAGWVRVGVTAPESVAAHCWGVAWLVLALCPPSLDRERALGIAIIHDLAEVRVGDLTPHDHVAPDAKRHAEEQALDGLLAPWPQRDGLKELWLEYERGESLEAQLVKACDKLDMALQAVRYRTEQGLDLQEFVDSALRRLDDPTLRCLAVGWMA